MSAYVSKRQILRAGQQLSRAHPGRTLTPSGVVGPSVPRPASRLDDVDLGDPHQGGHARAEQVKYKVELQHALMLVEQGLLTGGAKII